MNERPRNHLTYNAVLELLPAYTLGALDPDERLAVDEYLSEQQALFAQIERMEETAAQLAFAAPTFDPPAQIKSQLMDQIQRAQVQSPAAGCAEHPMQDHWTPAPNTDAPAHTRPVEKGKPPAWLAALRRQVGGTLPWPALAGATGIAILLLSLYTGQLNLRGRSLSRQIETLQQEVTELRSENDQLQGANDELQQQLREQEGQLALFVDAMQVVALGGTEADPDASGTFYVGRTASVLLLQNLRPLAADETYELWLIPENGDPIPAGLLSVDATGSATSAVSMDGQPQDFAAVGVSIEPAGGSPQPTGEIVLLGTVGS